MTRVLRSDFHIKSLLRPVRSIEGTASNGRSNKISHSSRGSTQIVGGLVWSSVSTEKQKAYKRQWMRNKRASLKVGCTHKIKPGHCHRCDILYEYGGKGDGKICDDCLNELGIL